jgi:hypothetical protein
MSVVLSDPAGFAVDWNWQKHLTVWTLGGRHYEPRFESKVLEHDLPDRPASQRAATAAARRWWKAQGRAEVLAATGQAGRQPEH